MSRRTVDLELRMSRDRTRHTYKRARRRDRGLPNYDVGYEAVWPMAYYSRRMTRRMRNDGRSVWHYRGPLFIHVFTSTSPHARLFLPVLAKFPRTFRSLTSFFYCYWLHSALVDSGKALLQMWNIPFFLFFKICIYNVQHVSTKTRAGWGAAW